MSIFGSKNGVEAFFIVKEHKIVVHWDPHYRNSLPAILYSLSLNNFIFIYYFYSESLSIGNIITFKISFVSLDL